jgi:hypothetical protein
VLGNSQDSDIRLVRLMSSGINPTFVAQKYYLFIKVQTF